MHPEEKNDISISTLCRIITADGRDLSHPALPGLNIGVAEIADILEKAGVHTALTQDLYVDIISALSELFPIYPDNYETMAFCLNKRYPDTDLIHLTDEQLREMICSLPLYCGTAAHITPNHTTAVVTVWAQLMDGYAEDDGMFDAYI